LGLKFRGRPKAEKMRAMIDAELARRAGTQEALQGIQKQPEGIPTPQEPQEPVAPPVSPQKPSAQSIFGDSLKSSEYVLSDNDVAQAVVQDSPMPKLRPGEKLYMTEEEWKKEQAKANKLNAGRLVRVRITCMNPNKKNWTGEIVSVGSAKIGTFKKFIPFGNDQPYHIPYIIYQELKNRKCMLRSIRQGERGKQFIDVKEINEFAIEVLPPLTAKELDNLRHQQAMARGVA